MSEENSKIYDEDLHLFPGLEAYKQGLKELPDLLWDSISQEDLYNKFYDAAVILPQMIVHQEAQNFNELKFFRVRLNINTDIEDLSLIQTYSYPPGFVCNSNGRANLKGYSVFYCSNNPTCALLESKPKIGDFS